MLKITWPQRGRPGLNRQILNFGNVWVRKKKKKEKYDTKNCQGRHFASTGVNVKPLIITAGLAMGCWARGECENCVRTEQVSGCAAQQGNRQTSTWRTNLRKYRMKSRAEHQNSFQTWAGELRRWTVWTALRYYYHLECVSNVFLSHLWRHSPQNNP